MHAYGSLLSFEVQGLARGRAVLEHEPRLDRAGGTHAVSLGDARTLVTHPATTTHASMPPDAREKAGIGDGLLRLSVGLESYAELERDLLAALEVRP